MKFSRICFLSVAFTLGFIGNSLAQEIVSLEEVIAIALQKNYDIQLAKNSAESAQIDNQYIVGAFVPQLNGVGSKVWNTNDQQQRLADNSTREQSGIRSENLNASLQLTWILFDGTRMFATKNRIAEIAALGEIAVKDEMVNTLAEVINSYYSIIALKQQLKATQEQMAVSEERVKLADRKLQVGSGAKPELLQAKVDLNAQRTQVVFQRTSIENVKNELNALVGMGLPENYDVGDTIIINLGLELKDISESIESTNYSLQLARQNISIAQTSLKERRAEYSPTIRFNSNYNFSRVENAVAINNFTPLFSQNNGFNYGFSIAVPILNGFNTRRLVRQAQLEVRSQEVFYEQAKSGVQVSVENAFANYSNAREILLIEEENILLAKENVFIALEGFKQGITTYIELRTAQQSLEDAYTRLIEARFAAKQAETELLRLSGALINDTL